MTQISREDVVHLAQLSNLQLPEEEIASLQTDLSNIVAYIDQLAELDTSGVEPTYLVGEFENVNRDDAIDPYGITREDLLKLAPEQADHQIKVPKVL